MAEFSFDSIMSWAIPLIIIFIFLAIFYVKLKIPMDTLFGWIKNFFSWMIDSSSEAMVSTASKTEITYE